MDKTKQRIGRYIEGTLAGPGNEEIRGLANKAIELAHHVKHSPTSTRREAGICALRRRPLAHNVRSSAVSAFQQSLDDRSHTRHLLASLATYRGPHPRRCHRYPHRPRRPPCYGLPADRPGPTWALTWASPCIKLLTQDYRRMIGRRWQPMKPPADLALTLRTVGHRWTFADILRTSCGQSTVDIRRRGGSDPAQSIPGQGHAAGVAAAPVPMDAELGKRPAGQRPAARVVNCAHGCGCGPPRLATLSAGQPHPPEPRRARHRVRILRRPSQREPPSAPAARHVRPFGSHASQHFSLCLSEGLRER